MNIGVFLPNWVGDSVMATPTIRALREHFAPPANLIAVLRPYLGPVFDGLPWFDERLFYDRGRCPPEHRMHRLLEELRARRFDKLILLTNSLSTAVLGWLSGAVERIGYDRYGRGCLLTHRLIPPRIGSTFVPVSAVDYYLRIAETLGCRDLSPRLELATTPTEDAETDRVWEKLRIEQGGRVVVFSTGGAYGVAKHWPVASFVALANRIVTSWDATVLVLCGPAERQTAVEIASGARHPRVTSLANEKLSLGLAKACVRRSTLMVSTDSGPRHFAAAFNIPTVALFGPTDPRWSINYNRREVALRLDLACSPCAKRVCPLGHHDCMRRLEVDDVFEAVNRLLSQKPSSQAA